MLDSSITLESSPRSFPILYRPVVFGDVCVRGIDGHINVDQCGGEGVGTLPGFEGDGTIEAALFTVISI